MQRDWAAGADRGEGQDVLGELRAAMKPVGVQSARMGSQGAGCGHGAGGSQAAEYSRGRAGHREQADSRNRV